MALSMRLLEYTMMFMVVSASLSALCMGYVWRKRRVSSRTRIWWSLVSLIPLVGPLFCLAFYDPPTPQAPADQAQRTDGDSLG